MSEQPEATVLIIHDAWHTPVLYSSFIDQLSSHCQVACPQLLSCNSESNNTSGFHDDCALIYQLCFDLACEGRDIVVFMHGYGGFIGTEILGDLGKRQRGAFGQTGGIVNLVYFASWLPSETNTKKSIWGEEWPVFIEEQNNHTLAIHQPHDFLFNDLGPMEQIHWSDHLVRFSANHNDIQISSTPAWSTIPTTFVICDEDQFIKSEIQERNLDNIKARSPEVEIDVVYVEDGGHDVFIAHPHKVVDVVRMAIAKAEGTKMPESTLQFRRFSTQL